VLQPDADAMSVTVNHLGRLEPMTKRSLNLAGAALVLMLALPAATAAQSIYAGVGASIPVGDFGDYADTGWLAVAGFLVPIGDGPIQVGAEGFYGQNNHSDVEGDKTNPYGVMGTLMFDAGADGSIGPYFFGGAGLLVHKFGTDAPEGGDSESQFGYQAGAGLDIPFGESVGGWVEARYMGSKDTNLVGFLAGLSVGIG
jgi:hypothetical protein